jgi:hypothetical protein
MFRALLSDLQEALHTQRLACCVLVMSVDYTKAGEELQRISKLGAANRHNTDAKYHLLCMQRLLMFSK